MLIAFNKTLPLDWVTPAEETVYDPLENDPPLTLDIVTLHLLYI